MKPLSLTFAQNTCKRNRKSAGQKYSARRLCRSFVAFMLSQSCSPVKRVGTYFVHICRKCCTISRKYRWKIGRCAQRKTGKAPPTSLRSSPPLGGEALTRAKPAQKGAPRSGELAEPARPEGLWHLPAAAPASSSIQFPKNIHFFVKKSTQKNHFVL